MKRTLMLVVALSFSALSAPSATAQWVYFWPRPMAPAWTPVFTPAAPAVPMVPIVANAPPTIERFYFLDDASPPPINSRESGVTPREEIKEQPTATNVPRVIIREYYLPNGDAELILRPVPVIPKPDKLVTPDWKKEYEVPNPAPSPTPPTTPPVEESKPPASDPPPATPATESGSPRT